MTTGAEQLVVSLGMGYLTGESIGLGTLVYHKFSRAFDRGKKCYSLEISTRGESIEEYIEKYQNSKLLKVFKTLPITGRLLDLNIRNLKECGQNWD